MLWVLFNTTGKCHWIHINRYRCWIQLTSSSVANVQTHTWPKYWNLEIEINFPLHFLKWHQLFGLKLNAFCFYLQWVSIEIMLILCQSVVTFLVQHSYIMLSDVYKNFNCWVLIVTIFQFYMQRLHLTCLHLLYLKTYTVDVASIYHCITTALAGPAAICFLTLNMHVISMSPR